MSDKIWFTSDTHFGHGNIVKYCHRPFLSERDKEELSKTGAWHNGNWKGEGSSPWRITDEGIAMMDDTLIANINERVMPNDVLYHLGDFAMPGKQNLYARCRAYRDRIKCRNVHIVWGNHDDYRIRDLFSSASDMKTVKTDDARIVLCHYALAVWDGSHRGVMHLYGHSHSEAEPWMDRTMVGRRSMDIGVDNVAKLTGGYRPMSLEEVVGVLGGRPGFAFDHHVSAMANTPPEQ